MLPVTDSLTQTALALVLEVQTAETSVTVQTTTRWVTSIWLRVQLPAHLVLVCTLILHLSNSQVVMLLELLLLQDSAASRARVSYQQTADYQLSNKLVLKEPVKELEELAPQQLVTQLETRLQESALLANSQALEHSLEAEEPPEELKTLT